MQRYDIAQLQRQLDNLEDHNDSEAQKLYNNLGLAHLQARRYRHALNAHRREKAACKRLVNANPHNLNHRLDLAIAYRRCGDVILKLDRLIDADRNLITDKADVIRAAHVQHRHALKIARVIDSPYARVERQAASAALAQSALALALETKSIPAFRHAAQCCIRAARLIDCIRNEDIRVVDPDKNDMTHGLAVNFAIALSGMGEMKKANTMLHAVALNAKRVNDMQNFVRALSNLAEEASDEQDWNMCQFYSQQWVHMARQARDEADESDALRKLAVALRENHDFRGAKQALQRAILIAATKDAADEARRFLDVVEQETDQFERMQRELAAAQRSAVEAEQDANFVEEAKCTLTAGNHAFALKKWKLAVELLQRYFVLVDEFGCNTAVTDVPYPVHNTAVANVAEAMWKMNKYEEAVKWASRELAVFEGDDAGQAQAWCNLGVYLDDFGKKHKAMDALKQSMFFAEKAGDQEIFNRAQTNLELVEEELQKTNANPPSTSQAPQSHVFVIDPENQDTTANSGPIPQVASTLNPSTILSSVNVASSSHAPGNNGATSNGGEKSVMMVSTQPSVGISKRTNGFTATSQDVSLPRTRSFHADFRSSAATKNSYEDANRSRSHPSRGATVTADRSSIGFKKVVDVVSEYKKICTGRQHGLSHLQPRIVTALQSLSSALIARDACDETSMIPAVLNLSRMLLNDNDVSIIFEILSKIGEDYAVHLNLSFNPTVTSTAYDCLNPRSYFSPCNLHCVKELNLSCSGLSGNALRILADALSKTGSLSCVTIVNVSKNALGRQWKVTAFAVARLLLNASKVQELDLALNLLPNTFMKELLDNLQRLNTSSQQGTDSPIRKVSFNLNNRCFPTAMLDMEYADDAVRVFKSLFTILPGLEVVDVRACGASRTLRRMLRELSTLQDRCSRTVVSVSDLIEDDSDPLRPMLDDWGIK
ncbi:Tonsoku-like protein [Gracilariopsis chorda]|uniref:Tonsoku-like protein n=1 Tax=Gracilariopsis chorda TaxID=448386 RepID=A0A2V3IEJ9_9FLOR|nr:Tonsoku-like protein [Gracilariopsis chorda]|eukprot:PXF40497.1 Tonsoku-like protein [Gracilariopsis chorda]